MLTKEYNDKMSRRNERIARLWKWRWLFVAISAILVIASVLLSLVGTVTDSYCESTVEYGLTPKLTANAIFGKVDFRYRSAGSEWTYSAPVDVGNYEAQAVSHGLAGRERFGDIVHFSITPAPLTVKVTDSEVDFGNLPQSVTANLKYSDKLTLGRFDVSYGDRTVDVTPVKEDIRVTDADNKDVTENYAITVQTKTIICRPLDATLTTPNGSWTYDGQTHSALDIKSTGLLDGHTFSVQMPSVTDVGTVQNKAADIKVLDEDGNDVTIHYVVTNVFGTLTVLRRPLLLTTGSTEWVYDGTEHTLPVVHIQGLADGQNVVASSWTSLEEVGPAQNIAQFVVEDGNGNDVTSNYDITEHFGSVTVTARPLSISTNSDSWVYDGEEHSSETVVIDGLAQGHNVSHGEWKTLKFVGEVTNDWDYVVTDGSGNDVAKNYNISEHFGTVAVTARPLTISTNSDSWVYDGEEHSCETVVIDGLAQGHNVFHGEWKTLKFVGEVTNDWDYVVTDGNGNDVTSNYDITEHFGTVSVTKRRLTVRTEGVNVVYDGNAHLSDTFDVENLAATDSVAVTSNYRNSLTDVGTKTNAVEYTVKNQDGIDVKSNYNVIEQWGTISVTPYIIMVTSDSCEFTYDGTKQGRQNGSALNDPLEGHVLKMSNWAYRDEAGSQPNIPEKYSVTYAGQDVTKNYFFDFSRCGTLTINQREVIVRTEDAEFVYDGTPKYHYGYKIVDGLLKKHVAYSFDMTKLTQVTDHDGEKGYEENKMTMLLIQDKYSGDDVSNNYKIKGEWGKIRIKAPIVVRLHSLSKFYDGTALSYQSNDWTVESVPVDVEKGWVNVELNGSLTDIGTLTPDRVRALSSVTVTDGKGRDLLNDPQEANRVDFVGSPLTVLPIPLTVSSISISRARSDVPLLGNVSNAAWISVGSLLGGHIINFNVTGVLTHSEQTAHNTFVAKVTDVNGRDVSKYYDITYVFGTLSWL